MAELQVTPDVPIALAQLSTSKGELLVVSCNQLYAVNKWVVNPGMQDPVGPCGWGIQVSRTLWDPVYE